MQATCVISQVNDWLRTRVFSRVWLMISLTGLSAPVWAQDRGSGEVVELESVIVTANPFAMTKEDLVVPASSLGGGALERAAQSSLGATLDGEPGVHSTYFGPGAGRPIIRGFDGDRVRILNQGTDSFDVSQTSPDHGVSIEPLFAHNVEVVRGPASLLYGNAAIGGVVNVIGKELPRERARAPLFGEFEASYGTVADERSAGLSLQGGESGRRGAVAWSFGYLARESNDLEIPGYAESVYLREAESEDQDNHENEGEFGVLGNSRVKTRSGYGGATWFGDRGSVGISYSNYDTLYGVPGHAHGHEDHEEEEAVAIDLDQSRFSMRAELLEPIDFFENMELQVGYGDYQHVEIENDLIGTTFDRSGFELRATGVHRPLGAFTGALGLHLKDESFAALGEEAFIPTNDSSSYGLFLVERLNRDWGAWEFGGRVESNAVTPKDFDLEDRSFTTVNASAGLVRRIAEGSSMSANLTYAERAPNASELYALGPHLGTRSFEIGDATLSAESSVNLDMSLRRSVGVISGEVSLFYSDFSDYVYMQRLSEEKVAATYGHLDTDGLPVFLATAADARFYGFELEARFHIVDEPDYKMHFDLLVDQTRATNESFDTNLPRIPTRRIGGRFEIERGPWLVGVEGRHYAAATHLAPSELPTDGYFLWGGDIRYRVYDTNTNAWELFAAARNLSDEEARPHTSYLKELAPLPGRDIQLGLRASF